jgi:hypothetical protein
MPIETLLHFKHHNNGLRADFDTPTNFIEVTFYDFSVGSFGAILQAYDISNSLLEEVILEWPQADGVTATINHPDISWIYATGYGGYATSIDLIRYNAVPIPAAVWLFGSGLFGLVAMARQKKAA